MQTGDCEEMQKAHAGKAIPGITVKLSSVPQEECVKDRPRLGIRQKPIQAGLNEDAGRFEYASHALPVPSYLFQTALHKIETSIDTLAEQIAPVIELSRISSTRVAD